MSHSPSLFGGLFASNAIGLGCIYLLSKYASLFVYSLLFSFLFLWASCCWVSSSLSSYKVSFFLFVAPICIGLVYKNILKSIPQAIKVAQLTCVVARNNSFHLGTIFFLCQAISLVFSGIWFIIFSHSMLIGFYHLHQPNMYLFNPTSFFVCGSLVIFYYWTCEIIGNIQRMLSAFVIIEWWKSNASDLRGSSSTEDSKVLQKEEFLLDLTDWIYWLWVHASGQICASSLIISLFSILELTLNVFLKIWSFTIGFFWMPFCLSASDSVLQHFLKWLRFKITISSSLTLLNTIKQQGSDIAPSLSESHAQIQRILQQQQVHVVAPGILHLLLDLCSLSLSALLALIAIVNSENSKLSTLFVGISIYWIIGSAVNKSLFRMIRDIADCILLCHIRSADGCILGSSYK